MLYYIIALFIIALDQLTKWLIVNELEIGERIPVIENVLYITSHRNQGAAWGILQGQMWFFYVITVIVVIGLVIYIQKYAKDQRLMGIALGLMLGGAIGNFIDRVIHQEVVDFVQTYIGTYPFPIFNIADSSLCVGVVLLFIVMLFEGKQEKEKVNEQHRN
ncbi:signal peptidase II [Bacillus sp. UMB0893]|uniref:signal peptidase II n=1 Tax=Bacillus sp. UMB0893 TaxID=2066053 RepID=UPI000C77B20D|nr:signal peptidase II [Bacillus sp. UMB0893]PLR69947.1 signal peptidase II [Bacillus sp. UMB0893]QNG58852.1 signal peptidase II [Bacillus sp. PAMC26568]